MQDAQGRFAAWQGKRLAKKAANAASNLMADFLKTVA